MMTSPLVAKKTPLYLIKLENTPIFQQLQLEEALLRADQNNWCLINRGTPPAIVMGISGKAEQLIDPMHWKKKPVPVIRRFSGGGTVFVDQHTLFITWICNVSHTETPCFPANVHQWAHCFYQKAFPELPLQLIENDYVLNGRKFGGNAQYLSKGRWLHHSSLLWDFDPTNMQLLKMPPKVPYYRQNRQHNDFLCRLSDHFEGVQQLESCFFNMLHQHFDLISNHNPIHYLQKEHRRATCYIKLA